MAELTHRRGDPKTIPYTPSTGDVSAGQVILLGNTAGLSCGIAVGDIANNKLGTLAVGGGFYDGTNLNNAANFAKVYWDDTNNKLTTTSTNNAQVGYVSANGGGGANTTCEVLHDPGM